MPTDPVAEKTDLVAEAVSGIPFVGKLLALAVRQRRWKAIALIAVFAFLLVIYPLFVPIMAAGLIRAGLLFGLAQPYAQSVRVALRIDEAAINAAKRSNVRLDYFQMIDVYGNANEARPYTISVEPYQRMRLRISEASLDTKSENCPAPSKFLKKGATIFHLDAAHVPLGDVGNTGTIETIELTKLQWDQMKPHMDGNSLEITLTPVEELQNVSCDDLKARVRMTVEVFKDDLLAGPAAGTGTGDR